MLGNTSGLKPVTGEPSSNHTQVAGDYDTPIHIIDKGFSVETEDDYDLLVAIVQSYKEPEVIKIKLGNGKYYIAHSEVLKYLALIQHYSLTQINEFLLES